jgi:hypothetical protein
MLLEHSSASYLSEILNSHSLETFFLNKKTVGQRPPAEDYIEKRKQIYRKEELTAGPTRG